MSVSLKKGSPVSLEKAGVGLSRVTMGLGWDERKTKPKGFLGIFSGGSGGGAGIDLDASAIMFSDRKVQEIVYFGHLNSKDGAIHHTGDNLTGAGDGDDEQIKIDLSRVPPHVDAIIFTVNSFRGDTFDKIENATCRILDDRDAEFARYELSESGPHTALIMAKVSRTRSGWQITAIGEKAEGRTAQSLAAAAARHA